MAAVKNKVKVKPERHVKWVEPFINGSAVIKITVGKEATDYYLDRCDSDFGKAFILTKCSLPKNGEADSIYHVCIENEQDGHCECKGFNRHGRCKHVGATRALMARGLI